MILFSRMTAWISRFFRKPEEAHAAVIPPPDAAKPPRNAIRADHPLVRMFEEHLQGKTSKNFKWPTVDLVRATIDRGYKPESVSPLLSHLAKQRVVRRLGKGRFEWVGFPPPRIVSAAKAGNADDLAGRLLDVVRGASDGITHGQIAAAFPSFPLHAIDGALGGLAGAHKIVKVSGRFYMWSDLDRRTAPGSAA